MEATSFGRYQLMDLLGRGGMGEVWRARDTDTNRIVALKVLPENLVNDEVFKQRFRREAEMAAQLTEPHVVPIHGYGEIDGRLYVDMRLIEGRDLQAILRGGPLVPSRAVMIVEQVAKALQAAHNVGLVHRDVKPSNVLVAEYDFAYLIDFGIARGVEQTGLTRTGSMIGTWAYMAPERFRDGNADARVDVYALACVLHECLTGDRPFPGDSLEQQITAHLHTPPPRPSVERRQVPRTFDDVISKGMAKNPDDRYRTTIQLADAARSAATTPVPRLPPPPPPTDRFATQRMTGPPSGPLPTGPPSGPLPTGQQPQIPTQRMSTPPPASITGQEPTYRAPVTPPPSAPPPEQPPTQRAGFYAGGPPSGPISGPVVVADAPLDEPTPRPSGTKKRLAIIGAILGVIVLAVGAGIVFLVGGNEKAGKSEVFLETASTVGQNPFTPSVSIPQPAPTNPGTSPAGQPTGGGDVKTLPGDGPGLYGGTRNLTTCDSAAMVTFLQQNPDKGRAWA
ncbi:MAG TPA: protein kinase, partial [Mycobacterium sp.]|nr:protein kinase [Mycobacterium sp.]